VFSLFDFGVASCVLNIYSKPANRSNNVASQSEC